MKSISKVDKAIIKDIIQSLFVLIFIISILFIGILGGIKLGNDLTYNIKYRDYVYERIASGYEVYLNGQLVDSDKISIYTYSNKSIVYDDEKKRVYIGCLGR